VVIITARLIRSAITIFFATIGSILFGGWLFAKGKGYQKRKYLKR